MNARVRKTIDAAPRKPGVYLWRSDKGRVLYVGKADNLRSRLRNYLNPQDEKTARLVDAADSVETVVTKSGREALVLEDALVKHNQPRYNVRLRDDKRYPYVKVTVWEMYPRVEVARRVEADGSLYFGPFVDAKYVRRIINLMGELFGVRTCRYDVTKLARPCIKYSMGKCCAPHQVTGKREYAARVRQACDFLSGRMGAVERRLKAEMKKASAGLDYERAAELKTKLDAIESMVRARDVADAKLPDMDVLGYAFDRGRANVTELKVRASKVVAVLHHRLKGEYATDAGESMKAFIKQHYTTADLTPKLVVTSCAPADRKLLEESLTGLKDSKVMVSYAKRGQKRRLADMAVENSLHQLEQERLEKLVMGRLESLKKTLRLPHTPHRIEGYDVSNLGGEHTVGSMVVFTDGAADKSGYRRFKVKAAGQDDPRNLAEIVERRFNHPEWGTPDLILIDGGVAQLNACVKHIPSGVTVAALAKKEEEIRLPGRRQPFKLPGNHPGLHLLQAVRDEAHRFAVSYHRKRRGKEFI
jgi:excinuclease ABC subunit C